MDKAAREAQTRAAAIDAAAFDLKAVNPNARVMQDLRTPAELLAAITAHGRDVTAALDRLRGLVAS